MPTQLTLVHHQGDKSEFRGILNAGRGTTEITHPGTSKTHVFRTTGDFDTTPVVSVDAAIDESGTNSTSVIQTDIDWDNTDADKVTVRIQVDKGPGSGNKTRLHPHCFAWEDETK